MLALGLDASGGPGALRDALVAREPKRAGRLLAGHLEHPAWLRVTSATGEWARRQRASDVAPAQPRPTVGHPRS